MCINRISESTGMKQFHCKIFVGILKTSKISIFTKNKKKNIMCHKTRQKKQKTMFSTRNKITYLRRHYVKWGILVSELEIKIYIYIFKGCGFMSV